MADTTRPLESTHDNEPLAFDDRTRRVLELRKQVREGTYRLDAEAIAKAILAEWLAVGEFTQDEPAVADTANASLEGMTRFVVGRTAPAAAQPTAVRSA